MEHQRFYSRPVGVFDSGIGGLTVAAEIRKSLPGESIIYLGDLLHLPYGTKSKRAVLDFTQAAIRFLISQNVKLLVIACNTATSIALESLKGEVSIPLMGVIEPGARAAVEVTENKRVGVIGTTRTIESNAYPRAIKQMKQGIEVFQKATPLLVPLIEEGWIGHPVMEMVLREYLSAFEGTDIDTIVLGCTHYPLIKKDIENLMPGAKVVDSAITTAIKVGQMLESGGFKNQNQVKGLFRIYLTDLTDNFSGLLKIIMKDAVPHFEVVSLNFEKGEIGYLI